MLLDEIVGHMREKIELPDYSSIQQPVRKHPQASPETYKPYKPDDDNIPPMADFGQGYRYHVTGLVHDESGFPDGSPIATEKLLKRLHDKIDNNLDDIVLTEQYILEDADIAIIAYGGTGPFGICSCRYGTSRRYQGRSLPFDHNLAFCG